MTLKGEEGDDWLIHVDSFCLSQCWNTGLMQITVGLEDDSKTNSIQYESKIYGIIIIHGLYFSFLVVVN